MDCEINLIAIATALPARRDLLESCVADPSLGKDQANVICGGLIAGQMGSNRPDLLIAGEQKKCRCPAVALDPSHEISRLGVRQLPPAVRWDRSARMLVRIDQRTQLPRALDDGMQIKLQFARKCEIGTLTGCGHYAIEWSDPAHAIGRHSFNEDTTAIL
jgi:hypothetical protein